MKNNLFTFLVLFFSISLSAQQTDKLYTPTGGVFHTVSTDGIGINEDKPDAALHINQSDDKGTALHIDLESADMIGGGYTNPEYAIKINKFSVQYPQITNLFSIDYNGTTRIGYGSTGTEKLMVGNSIGIYKSTSSNMIRLGYDGSQTQPQMVWKSSSSKNFQFKNLTTGAIPISLSPDGKVGINTEDFFDDHNLYIDGSVYIKDDGEEDHSLYIEGSSIAEEMFVKVKQQWPDYVFDDQYFLMPLSNLGEYIDKNGHLPKMPLASTIEEEGIATGETIRLLTEKVEELTLYLLQQQKETDNQQKEIEALKKQIEKIESDETK